jgi:hypothetical protein
MSYPHVIRVHNTTVRSIMNWCGAMYGQRASAIYPGIWWECDLTKGSFDVYFSDADAAMTFKLAFA